MKKYLLLLLAIIVSVSFGCATTAIPNNKPIIKGIEIIDYGIYSGNFSHRKADTVTGTLLVIDNQALIDQTKIIQASLGTYFGFRFKVLGEPTGTSVMVRKEYYSPIFEIVPKEVNEKSIELTGKPFKKYGGGRQVEIKIGDIRSVGYRFDDNWEMAPGTWTFKVRCAGFSVKKSFVVTEK